MPIFHTQNVLNGGEISPLLRGRVDQPRYNTGTRETLNFVPMPQGGATRRPGTRYLGTAKSQTSRLIPFVFSETDGYSNSVIRRCGYGCLMENSFLPVPNRMLCLLRSPRPICGLYGSHSLLT